MLKNTKHLIAKKYLPLFFVFLLACKSTNENAPIAAEKMESILLDLHYAEAYSSIIVTDSIQKRKFNKNTDSLIVFYKEIFDKHQVTATQFDSALNWYSMHPNLLDSVYLHINTVLDSLKTIPDRVQEQS